METSVQDLAHTEIVTCAYLCKLNRLIHNKNIINFTKSNQLNWIEHVHRIQRAYCSVKTIYMEASVGISR